MPPKADKTYSADIVAAVLHDFRPILAKAKELKALVGNGEAVRPVASSTKRATMGKTTDSPAAGLKMISADVVSVLLMALGNTTITKDQLNMMSAIDGTRTASSFEHQFRSIVAKAKELKKRVDDGETFTAVTAQKRGGTTTPATPKKRKGDDVDETPSKKPKATPKPRAKKAQTEAPTPQPADDDDVNLPEDMADFIKSEKKWEEDQFV
ncbi:hypothetical protein E8E11_010494 [Didymella keratinophila]|nr:hypothetical protein E8E11_010494 [Didymella keratinophila]